MKNFSLRAPIQALSLAALLISGIAIAVPTVIGQNNIPTPNQTAPQPSSKQGGYSDPLAQLNLTPDQTTQIKAIRDRNQPTREANMQRIKQLKQEMQTLLSSNAANFQITAKYDEIQAFKQQISSARLDQTLKIRAILTPEQRQKLSQISQNKRDKFREQMGSRRPNSTAPNQSPN